MLYLITLYLTDITCYRLQLVSKKYYHWLSQENFWRHRFQEQHGPLTHEPKSWRYYYRQSLRTLKWHREPSMSYQRPTSLPLLTIDCTPLYLSGPILVDVFHRAHILLFDSLLPFPGRAFKETIFYQAGAYSTLLYLTHERELRYLLMLGDKFQQDSCVTSGVDHVTCLDGLTLYFLIQRGQQLSYAHSRISDIGKDSWLEIPLTLSFPEKTLSNRVIIQFAFGTYDWNRTEWSLAFRTSDNYFFLGQYHSDNSVSLVEDNRCYYLTNMEEYVFFMREEGVLILCNTLRPGLQFEHVHRYESDCFVLFHMLEGEEYCCDTYYFVAKREKKSDVWYLK